jgi:hypothetical protein
MRIKPPHRSIPSSTRGPGQQIHHQPEGQDKQKIKNKTKSPQVAAEEHGIIDIPSEDMPRPKKTIRSKVDKTRSGSKSRFTN